MNSLELFFSNPFYGRNSGFAALILTWLLLGCQPNVNQAADLKQKQQSKASSSSGADYYLLINGRPMALDYAELRDHIANRKTPGLPWSNQILVSGYSQWRDRVFLVVNQVGVVVFDPARAASQTENQFSFYSAGRFLSGRTVGKIFLWRENLAIHVYRNRIFGDPRDSIAGEATPFLRFSLNDFDFSLWNPFPDIDTELWELSDLVIHKDRWSQAWKKVVNQEAEFRYLSFWPDSKANKPINRADFYDNYGFTTISQAPAFFRNLALTELADDNSGYYFNLQRPESGRPARHRTAYTGVDFKEARGVLFDDQVFLLIDNRLLYTDIHGKGVYADLPPLPLNCRYTYLWTDKSKLLLSWEEKLRFPRIGAAGLVLGRLPKN